MNRLRNEAQMDLGLRELEKHTFLALDAATRISGYSIWKGENLKEWGIHKSENESLMDNVRETRTWLQEISNRINPVAIFYEDIQLQGNVSTFKSLAKLQGVLECCILDRNISCILIPSATWKSHSCVRGRTRKEQKKNAILKVKELYGIKVSTDEADAILLGRYGISTIIS